MTEIPQEALVFAARAYKNLDRAIFKYSHDPEKFRHEVEMADIHLRGIAERMGWTK